MWGMPGLYRSSDPTLNGRPSISSHNHPTIAY
uniref:Uncharacterized protein n=1 Tax=Timema shepardi TaxID=629360 RepID=A0A7R9BAQ7_TIMSH|nr:unnamed protein product [Timema shepardi]